MKEVINTIEELCRRLTLKVREVVRLKGDASDRQIFRVYTDKGTLVAVYGDNVQENRAFLGFDRSLARAEVRVPDILAVSDDYSCYLLEDLGDLTLKAEADRLLHQNKEAELEELYCRAVAALPRIQIGAHRQIDYSLCYQSPVFDQENMLSDAARFKVYFLQQLNRIDDTTAFTAQINELTASLAGREDYFLYRDFQGRNIMLKNGELCFIDFQSGRRGPLQYDLASFVFSSGTHLTPKREEKMVNAYLTALEEYLPVNRAEFLHSFYGFGLIRVIQALGGYAYLGLVKNKKEYLEKIPAGLKQLDRLQELSGVEIISNYELRISN